MTAKTVACTIERRLLVNYRIEPELVARLLPWPFRPQLVSGLKKLAIAPRPRRKRSAGDAANGISRMPCGKQ
jgi:hypothetical protein